MLNTTARKGHDQTDSNADWGKISSQEAYLIMEQLIAQLGILMKQKKAEDIDLLKDEPGYDDFIKGSDMEYEKKDFKQAKVYYEKACKAGHPLALVNYGLWFLTGSRPGCKSLPVKKDPQRAFDMFTKSTENRNIGMAKYNLALFYHEGRDGIVKQDHNKAFKLAKEAIKDPRLEQMRQPDTWYLLGQMYMQGEGTFMNRRKATKMFEKAGEFGHPAVQPDFLKMMHLLEQVSAVDMQAENDARWNRMSAWLDEHPEENGKTVGEHLKILNKFGFELRGKRLSEKQLAIKGGFDVFMEVSGGCLGLMDEYEMEDEPLPPKKCEFCGKKGAKKRCSRCGEIYCSRECQKKDWKDHKKVCDRVVDAITL